MRISYQYRLKPNKQQGEIIDNTLDLLRCQYNYQLAQRFDWYEQCDSFLGKTAQRIA